MASHNPQHTAAFRDVCNVSLQHMPSEFRRQYTEDEVRGIQSRLDKVLGPEHISHRAGSGGKQLEYISINKAIDLANKVFGFNGWSTHTRLVQSSIVEEDTNNKGKCNAIARAVVRITLPDGTSHEDIGHGHATNQPSRIAAIMKVEKEAVSDAKKRALREFGKLLGNCLRDTEMMARIKKEGKLVRQFDASNVHRHEEFAPISNPVLKPVSIEPQGHHYQDSAVSPTKTSVDFDEFDDEFGGEPEFDYLDVEPTLTRQDTNLPTPKTPALQEPSITNGVSNGHSAEFPPHPKMNQEPDGVVATFTAAPRPSQSKNQQPPPFNPNAGTHAIQRTNGIDYSKSGRVTKDEVAARKIGQAATGNASNRLAPAERVPRQIGRPLQDNMQSPGQMRGQFKPPNQSMSGLGKQIAGIKREGEKMVREHNGDAKRHALSPKPQ